MNIKGYIGYEVKDRMKYLNLLVLVAFAVGQVQYGYVSYFCTMEQKAVQRPTMSMTSPNVSDNDMCDECQGIIPSQHGQQLLESSCMKVVSMEKRTVDNFAEWAKFHTHVIAAFNFIQAVDYPQQIGHQSFVVLSPLTLRH